VAQWISATRSNARQLLERHFMDTSTHTFADLFDQLGLPSSEAEIQAFVASHRPLPEDVKLSEAGFWSPAQAQFLREQLLVDADWAEVVDQLNVSLRA
jgi:hypothetical protein